MAPECTFILRNGQKCRAAATRNQPVCRHHAPKPLLATPAPVSAPSRPPLKPRLATSGPSMFLPELRAAIHAVIRNPTRQAFDDVLVAFARDGFAYVEDLPRDLQARLSSSPGFTREARG